MAYGKRAVSERQEKVDHRHTVPCSQPVRVPVPDYFDCESGAAYYGVQLYG